MAMACDPSSDGAVVVSVDSAESESVSPTQRAKEFPDEGRSLEASCFVLRAERKLA